MSTKKKTSSAKTGRTFTFDTGVGEIIAGRQSNSSFVFRFYREILEIEAAKETATFGAIFNRFKENTSFNFDEKRMRSELKLAKKDRLLRVHSGAYKINSNRCNKSDMYCFNCFKSGEELRKCVGCHRVYHTKCFSYCDIRWKCFFCKNYPQEPIRKRVVGEEELKNVLSILHSKLKKDYSVVVDATNYLSENDSLVDLVSNFIFRNDLTFFAIEENIGNKYYKSVIQYIFDCKQLIFNISVLHGSDSDLAKSAKEMEQFLLSEEHIIHNCLDCYINLSNKAEDDNGEWFLLQCNPPHEVCFVEVVGYPHYPAKVVEADNDDTFVRFFDENRETAETSNSFILPSLPKNTEMAAELKKAMEEYEIYVKTAESNCELQSLQE